MTTLTQLNAAILDRRNPSNWRVLTNSGGNVTALNTKTGENFSGTTAAYNAIFTAALELYSEVYAKNQALVDGAGNIAARLAVQGADKMDAPVQHMESTAAMSTTVTVRMAPTGTYRTARVSWVNNGASGTAKLNIAANCSNDVSGLVASQSSLQRDYQLTMAGSILLVSPVPITSLNFSSDVSITADTHRLVVTFGA